MSFTLTAEGWWTELWSENQKRTIFDRLIERRHGLAIPRQPVNCDIDEDFKDYEYDFEATRAVPDIEESVDNKGMALNQSPAYNFLLNAEGSIQLEEQGRAIGVVKRRACDSDGNMSGRYDNNPFLNSLVYEFESPYGYVKEYSANIIAENMLT